MQPVVVQSEYWVRHDPDYINQGENMENKARVLSSWKPASKREAEAMYQFLRYELQQKSTVPASGFMGSVRKYK